MTPASTPQAERPWAVLQHVAHEGPGSIPRALGDVGSGLVIRHGDPARELPALAREGYPDRVRGATPNGQTCSAGVSEWNRTDTADQLIARTDLALYEAKRTGRNRTAKACYEAVRHG